jgi:hypothetical protein
MGRMKNNTLHFTTLIGTHKINEKEGRENLVNRIKMDKKGEYTVLKMMLLLKAINDNSLF